MGDKQRMKTRSSSKKSQTVVSLPTVLPCETLHRAHKFYENGMSFLEMGEDYSALINFALAANTLTELRNLAAYVRLENDCLQRNPHLCETQQQSVCNLDIAIDKILRKVHVLKKRVIEIRSQYGTGAAGVATPGFDNECKQTKNIEIKYIKDSDECTKYCYERIIGAKKAKEQIQNGFVNPILYPNMFGKVSKGILLYGMPGTGKTLLAKATVSELQLQSKNTLNVLMFAPKGSDLKGKYFGETEQKIADLFECAAKLACERERAERESSGNKYPPRVLSVIFIDEIDAVGRDREGDASGIQSSSVNALLQAMDGIKSYPNVAVIAATNYPWKLDPAVRRRFETEVLVDLPNQSDIVQLLNTKISGLVSDIITTTNALNLCKSEEAEIHASSSSQSCSIENYSVCKNSTESYAWLKYQKLGYFRELTEFRISDIAKVMQQRNFSGSDIDQYFSQVIRASAQRAMTNGLFMVGPKIPQFEAFDKENQRALISTLGLSTKPWMTLAPLIKDIRDTAEKAANEQSIDDLGNIVLAPNAAIDRTTFATIQFENRMFRNVYEDTPSVTHFAYLPYQTDPLIRSTLIEVTQHGSEYHQVLDDTGCVLFHIAAPVQQGEIAKRPENNLLGLDKNFVYSTDNDQYKLLKELSNNQLHELYAIGKQDDMHGFIEVTIKDLQKIIKPTTTWSEYFGKGYLWGDTTFTSTQETQRIKELQAKMTSLLRQIVDNLNFNYYLLVGKDVYKISWRGMKVMGDFQTQLMDKLTTRTTVAEMPIYNIEVHPLAKITLYEETIALQSSEYDAEYTLLQNTEVKFTKHELNEYDIDSTMIRNIRFVNWSVGDADLLTGLVDVRGTFVANKFKEIQDYHTNPEQFIETQKANEKQNK